MLEAGQDLPLVRKRRRIAVGVHPALEELERDALLERVVVAHGEVDGAHAAAADLANEAVGAQAAVWLTSGKTSAVNGRAGVVRVGH